MLPSPRPSSGAPCVGILLWRRGVAGREVCALELEGRTVLPKGRLEQGDDELAVATRLARTFAGARIASPRRLRHDAFSGLERLSWWSLRWSGVDAPPAELSDGRVVWLAFPRAELALDHRGERELVHAERRDLVARVRERVLRARRRARHRAGAELDELEDRLRGRSDGPGEPGVPSWRTLALARVARAREALAAGDAGEHRRALTEARRLELFGMEFPERVLVARELAHRAEVELPGGSRLLLRELLSDPGDVRALARGARLVADTRERREEREQARREERAELAGSAGVALLAVATLGSPAWYARDAVALPGDFALGVLLFGALGGLASAFARPGSARRGGPSLRAVLGAAGALVVFALVRGGWIGLPVTTAPGWLGLAFAAGFLERAVLRPPPGAIEE